MKRTEIIQKIIDKTKARTYLEIGVFRGSNFFPVKAGRKIGVDPQFSFGSRRKIKWWFKNLHNLLARYYETDSDSFFARNSLDGGVDVAFIDGLHTYQQSLKDVENSIKRLNPRGVIIMHDCNPQSEAAACPALSIDHVAALNPPDWDGQWNGDVWKTICYLRSTRHDLNIFVLDCDQGLGIITRGKPEEVLSFTPAQVDNLTYSDLAKDRERLLNLKGKDYLFEFLKTI